MTFTSTTMTSPIGPLTIVADDRAIVAIEWATDTDTDTDTEVDTEAPGATDGDRRARSTGAVHVAPDEHPILARAVRQLDEYFAGTRTEFDLPLDAAGTDFQRRAWDALVRIPFGETISYGEQAVLLGDRNKSRAVGAANGKNPIPIVVPCHRVVGSNGHLTGFAGGLDTKAWLLDHERRVRAGRT